MDQVPTYFFPYYADGYHRDISLSHNIIICCFCASYYFTSLIELINELLIYQYCLGRLLTCGTLLFEYEQFSW